jgi:hypothetical protein
MLDRFRFSLHQEKKRLFGRLRKRFPHIVSLLDDSRKEKVLCKSCGRLVPYAAWHLGFSGIIDLACDRCPDVLLVDDHEHFPYGAATSKPTADYGRNWLEDIQKLDGILPGCPCGGRFAFMHPPRCPHCCGLLLGDTYENQPILKVRAGYSIVPRRAYRLQELRAKQSRP